jgi:hypothetical protein
MARQNQAGSNAMLYKGMTRTHARARVARPVPKRHNRAKMPLIGDKILTLENHMDQRTAKKDNKHNE